MTSSQTIQVEGLLLHSVYERAILTTALTALSVPLFASQMWPLFSSAVMALWIGAFCLNIFSASLLSFFYRRAGHNAVWDEKNLAKWQRRMLLLLVISGTSWGIGPALLMTDSTGIELALLVGILLVASAVAVNSIADYLPGIITYLMFSLLMPATAVLLSGESLMYLIAMTLIAGFGALLMVSKSANTASRAKIESENDLKIAIAQAHKARTLAEAASQAKSQFLATMSHELRTPLNAVIGGAQLLRKEQIGSAEQAQHINAIQQSGVHLLGLIENILDLSRVETGEMPLHSIDFDLSECVFSAVNIVKLNAQAKGLSIHCDIDEDMPTWRFGDPQRLNQILINLLGNAVKFTQVGDVRIRVAPFGDNIRIEVTDTGMGISAEALPFIFDPFRQADQGSNRRFGGSGLGLAIVRLWIQAMQGNVSVTSHLGEGSCFRLELPLPKATTLQPTTPAAPITPTMPLSTSEFDAAHSFEVDTSSRHVLVVEDDAFNQAVIMGLLRHAGNRVSLASNGQEAIRAMQTLTDVQLVLMDWYMPDMDGLEVTRHLRSGAAGIAGKTVPIVALTANAFAEDRAQCLAAGMDDFLTKPVLLEDLKRALQKWAPTNNAMTNNAVTNSAETTVQHSVPEHSAFDLQTFAKLSRLADDSSPHFAQEMLRLFIDNLAPTMDIIQRTPPNVDLKELLRTVHSLKSASASIGALELSELSAKHEAMLRLGQPPAPTCAPEFLEAIKRFEEASATTTAQAVID
jgi:two-component system, sensor histidine kinase